MMSEGCRCVGERESVRDAARRMAELGVGAMPICGEDDRLKGMLTDRDIVVKVVVEGRDPAMTKAGELGEGTPVWVEADADVDRAIALMSEHGVRRLPVIAEHRLVGILSQADIARDTPAGESGDMLASISAAPANN
jgi:CBS domain-containing protein